ncbi:branched-chain amino acid ABC transporter substrate-binding protein [Maritimibacter sp. UBA3975]|uniref:branched-chain amino acid ABC transporter substrate-binding protein n=1 Tax=Maritimibacter sp. UBA3975 TaxID=1946833 RepID=UPI000C094B55|nr:branched-chain amino acid ABC transporter substrate-binding protein [Maritimibacter sp. UBA3975]MAM62033.1 branched-chain amino acid ABC transporter substrate-binding protein [Maritimibacter sp.]|tara:strand:+ start:14323 stop:15558 length:1236 start_codon:yes stop_codon:yes gene_type:complete
MTFRKTAILAAATSVIAMSAASADTIKFAFIDPLSGPFGPSGEAAYTSYQLAAEHINENGGVNGDMIEVMGYDNKVNPKESLVQFQKAIDDGARYIVQGNGSSVAAALIEAVNKHNARNPGDEVVFFNYAAVTPAFTNELCSFWHFRFDAHADMKMAAITDWIAERDDIKSVYLIGQDYVFGQAVASAAEGQLTEKRPDIEIVGNELHPLGKVKDFTPYIQKIISSGADAVITGNWGADMQLLMKAAAETGSDVPYLTFYGGSKGAVSSLGDKGVGLLHQVSEGLTNLEASDEQYALIEEYKERFPDYDYYYHRIWNVMDMFKKAAEEAGTADPIPVAKALEGMTIEHAYGTATMRAEDHQLQQPLYISVVSDDVKYGVDNIDLGWKLVDAGTISMEAAEQPTTCEMERPE